MPLRLKNGRFISGVYHGKDGEDTMTTFLHSCYGRLQRLSRGLKGKNRLGLALLCGFFLSLVLGAAASFAQNCAGVADQVLRLHVIANSDSSFDQEVKLKVRDAVVETVSGLFAQNPGIRERNQAEDLLRRHQRQLVDSANQVLAAYDCGYEAQALFGQAYFPNRVYGSVMLPAGEYEAVCITLGQAQGRNWWCVLFPSLCIPAALEEQPELSDLLTGEQNALVEEGSHYTVKFALWEWLTSLF